MRIHHLTTFLIASAAVGVALADLHTGLESQGKVIATDRQETVYADLGPAKTLTPPAAATMRVGSTGSSLFGFMSYRDEDDFLPGWYEVAPDGSLTRLWKYHYAESGVRLTSTWLRGGRLCALAALTMGSDDLLVDYAYQEMDPDSGELLVSRSVDVSEERLPYFVSAAYCPDDDRIYGFGKCGDNTSETYCFKSAPADAPEEAVVVGVLDAPGLRCMSFCYSEADRCFYGINTWGTFVRVLPDGSYEELFATDIENLSNGKAALTESPNDGFLLWNPNVYDNSSCLYAIWPGSKRTERLCGFDRDCQFMTFITTDGGVAPDAPETPELLLAEFVDDSLTGTLEFRIPSQTRQGASLASVGYSLYDNGTVALTGTAVASDSLSLEVTADEGMHTFRLEVEAGGLRSLPAVARIYVGNDTPLPPAEVRLMDSEISWTSVTQGVHGGFVNGSSVRYRVCLNDEVAGETEGCSLPVSIDADLVQDVYRASVTAFCAGHESEPAFSDRRVIGRPYDLPMLIAPTEHDAEMVTIFNLDGSPDYGVWRLSDAWGGLCFASGWSFESPDDWLIMPAAYFPSNEVLYSVCLEAARGGYTGQREYFEVWAGPEPNPEAMTIPVIGKTRAQKFNDWKEYSGVFSVPRAGAYYIAVRSVSDPDQKDLIVRNIRVEATETATAVPMAVEAAEVTATDDVHLNATVSFILPSAYINGDPIPSDAEVTAVGVSTVDGKFADAVEVTGDPGEKVSLVVPTLQGENYITITNMVGGLEGQKAEVSVFTGMDVIGYVEDYTAEVTEDNMGMHLSWKAPIETLNGGYSSYTGVNYWVAEVETDGNFLTDPIFVGTDVTEYTYVLPKGSAQRYARVAVVAENAAGISPARWYQARVIGTPYKLPVEEHFEDMQPQYAPLVAGAPTVQYADGNWTWCQPELVDPAFENPDAGFAIIGYTDVGDARVRMNLPKVSTEGIDEASAWFAVWTGRGSASDVRIYATSYGIPATLISNIPASDGWNAARISIPEEFLGKKWISLTIDGYLADSETYLIMHSYSIDPFDVSSVDAHADGCISTQQGNICIQGFGGSEFMICGIDGGIISKGRCSDACTIAVETGVYIVSVAGRSFKIYVK